MFKTLNSKVTPFVRANASQCLLKAASEAKTWTDSVINHKDIQITTLAYRFGDAAHRVVAYRVANDNGQINIFTSDSYKYMFIITNY
ncbi:MAG: hypothetical protein ACK5H1_05100 [Tenacibaculum sp.]